MVHRYPGDGAAANGFGRRHLHEDEAGYPAPPDMRAPGSWRLSTGAVPVHPVPSSAGIARIRSSVSETAHQQPRYAPDNHNLWATYFERRREEQLASTNSAPPSRGRHNSEGRRRWRGFPGRTLEAILEHIKADNTPRLDYPAPSISRRSGLSWQPRRMATPSSSSSGSHSSGARTTLVAVKAELGETPLRRSGRSGGGGITINEGRRRQPSLPPRGHLRLVRPKTKPDEAAWIPVAIKQEHLAMPATDETALKWAHGDYVHKEMERQRRALVEIAARHRGREEGNGVILDDDEEKAPGPSNLELHRHGDPRHGCGRDGGDDDDNDYTTFYRLFGM